MFNQSQIHSFINLIHKNKAKHCLSKSKQDSGQNLPQNFSSLRPKAFRQSANNVLKQDKSLQIAYEQRLNIQTRSFRLKQRNYNFYQKKNAFQKYHQNLLLKKQLLKQMIEDDEKQLERCNIRVNLEQNRQNKYSNVYYNSGMNQMQKHKQSTFRNASPNKQYKLNDRKLILFSQGSCNRLKINNIHRSPRRNQWPKIKKCKSIKYNNICYQPCYQIKKIYTQPAMIVRNQSKSITLDPQFQQKQAESLEQLKVSPYLTPNYKKNSSRMLMKSNSTKNKGNLNTTFKINGWDYKQCQQSLEDLYSRK